MGAMRVSCFLGYYNDIASTHVTLRKMTTSAHFEQMCNKDIGLCWLHYDEVSNCDWT
jgi:hypothetical protein